MSAPIYVIMIMNFFLASIIGKLVGLILLKYVEENMAGCVPEAEGDVQTEDCAGAKQVAHCYGG